MGTWGVGLFQDDLALEVRDVYRNYIGEGHSPKEFMRELKESWGEYLDDPNLEAVIWLALAVTQWKLGRLDDLTRTKALDVIASGRSLDLWREPPQYLQRRQAVLAKVATQISSP